MKLETATAVLRPRSAWEAVDLGWIVARRHYGMLMAGWAAVALPVWGLICLVLWAHPVWALVVMWWVKPLLTRQPVYFLSRVLFGQVPRPLDFWREWRTTGRSLLWWLTIGRISTPRSLLLAVPMLEGLTGKAASQRCGVLHAHGGQGVSRLCMACGLLSTCLLAGLLGAVWEWLPETLTDPVHLALTTGSMDAIREMPLWVYWLSNGLSCFCASLIEPLYAVGGFSLYINTRTHLEGWDIEVALRRMAARLSGMGRTILAMVAVFFLLLQPAPAQLAPPADPNAPAEQAAEILRQPDFSVAMKKTPVFEEKEKEKEHKDNPDAWLRMDWMGGFPGWILIFCAAGFLAWMLYQNRHALKWGKAERTPKAQGPRVLMGMDITPQSLPADIPAAAWAEWLAGRPQEALRLLYRGSLSWLVVSAQLPIRDSDTEGDCLAHAATLPDAPRAGYFQSLSHAWSLCAYAAQPPDAGEMRRLCEAWPFAAGGKERVPAAPVPLSAAVLLLLVPVLLLSSCQQKQPSRVEERPEAYSGAARFQPWLAATRLLQENGIPAYCVPRMEDSPVYGSMLLVAADDVNSAALARSYRQYAQRGIHLVVMLSHADQTSNDFSQHHASPAPDSDPILQWAGITTGQKYVSHTEFNDSRDQLAVIPTGSVRGNAVSVEVDGERWKMDNMDGVFMRYKQTGPFRPDIMAGSENEALLLSAPVGSGRITFLASGSHFRNRWLPAADHAALLLSLAQLTDSTEVTFLLSSRISFMGMLMKYAWMPLLGLAALVLLWLWRHMPRFGSIQPADARHTRHFGTQLDEAGRYLRETAQPSRQALEPARRLLQQSLAHVSLPNDPAARTEALAAAAGLQPEEVQAALEPSANDSPESFIQSAAALQRLLQTHMHKH